jgi:hypothetical protein
VFPLLAALLAALSAPASGPASVAVDVPYLAQTEALCGGAAVAMVFRYWGESHASVNQFAPLVDRRAGGIATGALVDAVRRRGWQADELAGSIEMLREELALGRPIVVLLSEGRRRLHYVVVTALEPEAVRVHDPTWGMSRRIALHELLARWAKTGFWSLRIRPAADVRESETARRADPVNGSTLGTECSTRLAHAVDEVRQQGFASADRIFEDVRMRCADASGPLRELAGVRFAERQWSKAAALAEQALSLDPHDSYAWEVLAASRFVQDDRVGALDAWNHVGKPQVDSIRIEGLTRTRYALVAETLGVPTDTLLTPEAFGLARRRLQELPDRTSARLDYRPQTDGFATIDVSMLERAARPRGGIEWAAEAARTVIDREAIATVPGWSGQGEIWTASWRWWSQRPRAALAFSAPRVGRLPGVWRVEASWERQTYALDAAGSSPIDEERAHAGFTVTNWLTSRIRYQFGAGLDAWSGTGRAASLGGSIERRWLTDRLSLAAEATTWAPVTTPAAFHAGRAHAAFRSSNEHAGTSYVGRIGIEAVSGQTPLALWSGAGDGRAREPLLRGHRLLRHGVVDGTTLGRQLEYFSFETQRWLFPSWPARLGVAAFFDGAHASRRAASTDGNPLQIDAGLGLRVKMPGRDSVLRVDIGRGLRDGSHALSVGWQH